MSKWARWVFQGTVGEDGTGGTHVITLTITPGSGNECELQGGHITVGTTATAQTPGSFIDDGANIVTWLHNPSGQSSTASAHVYTVPNDKIESNITGAAGTADNAQSNIPVRFGDTMRLVLRVSTTQVSITQTFAVVLRIRGGVPTATLADTVGTPTLTTNTERVF